MTEIRTQKNSLHVRYLFLADFDQKSFDLYAHIKGGTNNKMKPGPMRKRAIYLCQPFDPPECVMKMIDLREQDQYSHILAWQGLKTRFTDVKKRIRKTISEDPDKFWRFQVSRMFSKKMQEMNRVSEEWQIPEGKELAFAFLKELWHKQQGLCAISGHNMQLRIGSLEDWNHKKASVDRIDSDKPYGPNNIQLVCSFANQMKMDISMRQFKSFIKDIAMHQKMELK